MSQTELDLDQGAKMPERLGPVIQMGEAEHADCEAQAEDPMVILVRDALYSPSFKAIMVDCMEAAIADIKISISQKLAKAVIKGIDFDEIANDVIDNADVHSAIVEGASESVEQAMSGAF